MAGIQIDNVSKTYAGGVPAVRGVTLDVPDGELAVLVGPSGCGKSTMLRMIAGLEEVDSGTISIGGRVVNDVAPKDRDIAMVFQNYALYPHMTVYKNMAFALKLRRIPKAQIDARVQAAAKTLGIEELMDRKPGALSGGQRQRVAVGRAMVREPKAFLFDEPLSNLDARLRLTTRAELKALHLRLKTTTIYVTHDQEEAMTLGDRVVVMARGLVQQIGPPLTVYREPVNRFVASFIGMPPMNFIEGTVRIDDGRAVFQPRSASPGSAGLRLGTAVPEALRARGGQELVLGVRPQAMAVSGTPTPASLSARIDVVELLGDQSDLFCTVDGVGRILARVPAARYAPGDRVTLALDTDRVHLFEPGEFGANLMLGAPR